MVFDENSQLGDLLNNAATAAVLEKYLPGISTNPVISLVEAYTLKEIASFPQTNLSQDKVMAIVTELAAFEA